MSSKKNGGGVQGDSLNDLAAKTATMLNLPEPDLSASNLEKQAEEIRKRAAEAQEWASKVLVQLDNVRSASLEAQELMESKVAEVEGWLNGLLNHQTPAYRRAAYLAILLHNFTYELENWEEVKGLMADLVQDGYLVEDPAGTLEVSGKKYNVPKQAAFTDKEMTKAQEALKALLDNVYRQVGRARRKKSGALREQGEVPPLTLLDWQGQTGEVALYVPPEFNEVRQQWFGGGTMLMSINDKGRIFPQDAAGAIERGVNDAIEAGVFLQVESLKWDKPPFVKALPKEQGRKVQLLWHLLKRGLRAESEKQRTLALRESQSEKATVTSKEFFLEKKLGICLVEFQGVWRSEGVIINHLFFLAERTEKDGIPHLHIAEVPEHLRVFFQECMEEYPQKEEYEGVPRPLGSVLRAAHKQEEKMELANGNNGENEE